jgi:hypothetical protein
MTKYTIWYMKPEWFREGICYARPDPKNLGATHIKMGETEIVTADERGREGIFTNLNTTYKLPGIPDFRLLVRERGAAHTSMSVGDVLSDDAGKVWLTASFGFEDITDKPPMTTAEVLEQRHAEREAEKRNADHVDGYDRDDIGLSPDF